MFAAKGIRSSVRVLDVAAGSANISLPAAESGAAVISTELARQYLVDGGMEWEYLLLTAKKR